MKNKTSYFYQALEGLSKDKPPKFVENVEDSDELEDNEFNELQQWCLDNRRIPWATGISIIEAAESIVKNAIRNANIPNLAHRH